MRAPILIKQPQPLGELVKADQRSPSRCTSARWLGHRGLARWRRRLRCGEFQSNDGLENMVILSKQTSVLI